MNNPQFEQFYYTDFDSSISSPRPLPRLKNGFHVRSGNSTPA